jgi:hypothetical protein
VNPEDHRWKLATLLNAWPDKLAAAREIYNPSVDSPFKLFDPRISLTAGAIEDAYSGGLEKEDDFDVACSSAAGVHNTCSWEAVWRWRFCAFNTGHTGADNDGHCSYSNRIFGWTTDSQGPHPPLADTYTPQ